MREFHSIYTITKAEIKENKQVFFKYYELLFWFFDCLIVFLVAVFILVLIDTRYYGELTFTPFNFFWFNTILKGSELYGTHNILWYFIVGIPTILTSLIICLGMSLLSSYYSLRKQIRRHDKVTYAWISKMFPFFMALFYIIVLSFNKHKEFRFLFPVLPILIIYSGIGLWQLLSKYQHLFGAILVLLILTNSPHALYLGIWHQSGKISIMHELYINVNKALYIHEMKMNEISVDILLECHSTPLYAYMHLDTNDHITMNFLKCDPHFDKETNKLTRNNTPSWALTTNPQLFLSNLYTNNPCPTFIMISSFHEKYMDNILNECKYHEISRKIDNWFIGEYYILYSNINDDG